MKPFTIDPGFLDQHDRARRADLEADLEHLGRQLRRRGVEVERLVERAQSLRVALPSWGLGT
ncbi:MAG TPA: sugar isomerase, partial [Vicinamibacteria bacterium]|nr:sugar isomerase [Vicinamibacteria bacterium]